MEDKIMTKPKNKTDIKVGMKLYPCECEIDEYNGVVEGINVLSNTYIEVIVRVKDRYGEKICSMIALNTAHETGVQYLRDDWRGYNNFNVNIHNAEMVKTRHDEEKSYKSLGRTAMALLYCFNKCKQASERRDKMWY